MRRGLLTARAVVPLTVGNPAVIGTGNRFVYVAVDTTSPATAGGTLTTFRFYASAAGTIRVLTGTLSGSNYTVRAATASVAVSAGLNTLTISLAVVAGDLLGVWCQNGSSGPRLDESVSGSGLRTSAVTAAPVATSVIALTNTDTGQYSMNATG